MAPTTRSKQSSPTPDLPTSSTTAIQTLSSSPARMRPREGSRTRQEEVFDAKYAVDLATTTVDENVFLFVPNLIGYTRVILAAASLYYMPIHPKVCTVLYAVSCLLDAVDGQAARALGQTSKFGAVLDMVTDRCTTACLLCFLSTAYPRLQLLFQFLITLDFSSHYIHMYSSLVTGSSSHKTVTSDVSRILWLYYNDSRTLFLFCFMNELFFVCLYLNAYWVKPISPSFSLPSVLLSSDLALSRPWLFMHVERTLRNATWPQLAGIAAAPWMIGKQIINCVQFWKASKILVGVDLAERQAAREAAAHKSRGQ
ncbi:CDP-diacylglycerol-inositol 3-phosphatidyltransferase [Tremella mesenterica]|uniref:CDP-diacylglycerol-inositol 3-phosphatidyltransferase n=1 Tax=Tremella mesenterica TaxID=5217 RepID=A0A4Q1BRA0_TREME|nr:uncharacterized protein TREMEDRAFT_45657 [Tremella mesenterica DSM 1558]EIW66515.1 hypothetical protein TREMEDRAFT_45657 [Tremella mesenterica DSM 1558]RXK40474.1 CDP-diacylglycerol-inositol 3-phosphatidyltransferase [Tremella mesenterica]